MSSVESIISSGTNIPNILASHMKQNSFGVVPLYHKLNQNVLLYTQILIHMLNDHAVHIYQNLNLKLTPLINHKNVLPHFIKGHEEHKAIKT